MHSNTQLGSLGRHEVDQVAGCPGNRQKSQAEDRFVGMGFRFIPAKILLFFDTLVGKG